MYRYEGIAPDMREENEYPLDIRADMSPNLSRWLWLIKWILAIPHFVILLVLSVAAFVVWIIAWWAILFTARYPQGLFRFNVGVMRWWWRVAFYAFVLGTDRYPPFSLAPRDNYPADLSVRYPERLSRLKVVFKWWLLAIPHYLVVMLFVGMSIMLQNSASIIVSGVGVLMSPDAAYRQDVFWHGMDLVIRGASSLPFALIAAMGLSGVLILTAAITLLFRGWYPQDIFEIVVGMQRWGNRVSGYAGLLYDEYPPFRFGP